MIRECHFPGKAKWGRLPGRAAKWRAYLPQDNQPMVKAGRKALLCRRYARCYR
jgi:hypothetical protein